MTDKIQLIKEELKRRISNLEQIGDRKEIEIYFPEQFNFIRTYEGVIQFIDSLPEANEDLEEEIEIYSNNVHFPICYDDYKRFARHFAEWQKNKDLEDSLKSDMTMSNKFYEKGKADAMKEMKETLQTEYEKGRFDMIEEMLKDAVEGEVVYKIGNAVIAPTDVRYKVMSDRVYIPNVKLGDKVKIIICKTEQQ